MSEAGAMRIVSLVPSLTETVAALGMADRLVGVTDHCTIGAPDSARRVGGSKYFDVEAVRDLYPDLVLANVEENRREAVEALQQDGLEVLVTFPRAVADVTPMLEAVAAATGCPGAEAPFAAEIEAALERRRSRRNGPRLRALTLVWRKPWMALGRDTYGGDLLELCGFQNAIGSDERYPRLSAPLDADLDVVLLPSEPYAFGPDDLPAVRELAGDVPTRFVDGRLLTWHGPSTATAIEVFGALADELADTDG